MKKFYLVIENNPTAFCREMSETSAQMRANGETLIDVKLSTDLCAIEDRLSETYSAVIIYEDNK